MAYASMSGLPTEVLNHIFDYVIPVTRLARQAILDAEWSRDCAEPRCIPPLLFVNKKLSHEAGKVFYTKAILEVAPVRPPGYILNALDRPDVSLDLAVSLSVAFASVPAHYLAWIRNVFMYSDQRDAVSAEGYEATLRWLIEHTNVKYVYLSQRLMTRLRKFRIDLDCAIDFLHHHDSVVPAREIQVYATHDRSYWERIRMKEMAKAMQGNSAPLCQYFLIWPRGPLLLDPRWDARSSDDDHLRQNREAVAKFLDNLAAARSSASQPPAARNHPIPTQGQERRWLYQLCFVMAL